MEIILADQAGFCFGVRRSLRMAEEALGAGEAVSSVGPLIHNRQVVTDLEARGLAVVDGVADVHPDRVLIVRAHGVGPELLAEAERRGLRTIDATCPFVKRAQQAAVDLTEQGYQVFVVGERDHPEVQAIVAHTGGRAQVVDAPDHLAPEGIESRVGVVAQTTQSVGEVARVVEELLRGAQEIRIANTICQATTDRQASALRLAEAVDVMIVIGGRHSANTRRLAELCAGTGTPTQHIETAEEIDAVWLRGVCRVGVTAGASTPQAAVEATVGRLRDLSPG